MSYSFNTSMMRIFLSYKFSGVEKERLDSTIIPILHLFRNTRIFGYPFDVWCSYELEDSYRESGYDPGKIMNDCFDHIDRNYLFFMFVDKGFGEGMLIELGYALSRNKRIILIAHNSVKSTTVESLAEIVIRYEEMSDLLPRLERIMSHFF